MLFEAAMGNMTQNWTREAARNSPTSHGYPVTDQIAGIRFRAYDLAYSQNITSLRSYGALFGLDGTGEIPTHFTFGAVGELLSHPVHEGCLSPISTLPR